MSDDLNVAERLLKLALSRLPHPTPRPEPQKCEYPGCTREATVEIRLHSVWTALTCDDHVYWWRT